MGRGAWRPARPRGGAPPAGDGACGGLGAGFRGQDEEKEGVGGGGVGGEFLGEGVVGGVEGGGGFGWVGSVGGRVLKEGFVGGGEGEGVYVDD